MGRNQLAEIRDYCKRQIKFRKSRKWSTKAFEELLELAMRYFAYSEDIRAIAKRRFMEERGGLEGYLVGTDD